jgi:4'-phosphopantetheinyl transferase
VAALSSGRRSAGFLRLWTGKEAVLKAIGHGLRHPTQSFELSSGSEGPLTMRPLVPDPAFEGWRLSAIAAGPGYAATACWRGDRRISYRSWEPAGSVTARVPL